MSYNIYIKKDGKRELVEAGANYRTCEIYRECCKSAEFEDHAGTRNLLRQLPGDDELRQTYGVRDARCLESAGILTLCIAATGLIVVGALLLEMLS